MRNHDRINALPPAGIETKRAHIVGGGIAVGYRKYSRQDRLEDQQRATGGAEPPPT